MIGKKQVEKKRQVVKMEKLFIFVREKIAEQLTLRHFQQRGDKNYTNEKYSHLII